MSFLLFCFFACHFLRQGDDKPAAAGRLIFFANCAAAVVQNLLTQCQPQPVPLLLMRAVHLIEAAINAFLLLRRDSRALGR